MRVCGRLALLAESIIFPSDSVTWGRIRRGQRWARSCQALEDDDCVHDLQDIYYRELNLAEMAFAVGISRRMWSVDESICRAMAELACAYVKYGLCDSEEEAMSLTADIPRQASRQAEQMAAERKSEWSR